MPSAGLTRVGRFVQRALASARYRALDARRRLRDWRLRPSSMASGAGFEGDAAAARGVLFVLSGVPIDDTGGGARCTQFALEALRQGFAVVFVNRFPKRETVDLKLEIRHPLLVTSALAGFSLDQLRRDHPRVLDGKPVGVLVEFAVPEFVPLLAALKEAGAVRVYDLLDDWDSSLGGAWYDAALESSIAGGADVLVATLPILAERLGRLTGGRPVHVVPNAASLRVFDPAVPHARPADLPRADWIAVYFGALWGEWFDWDLLVASARAHPDCAFVLIGDYRGQCPERLPNLHFLGLKAQADLPAYLAHAQVAFVPWKVGAITLATSPIKVYEFLAMGKPVVAPDLPALAGMPLVLRSRDHAEFAANLARARGLSVPDATLETFRRENSWEARTAQLLALVTEAWGTRHPGEPGAPVELTFSPSGRTVRVPGIVEGWARESASPMLDAHQLMHLAGTLAAFPWRDSGPRLVVEIGAFHGRTTVFMARVLEAAGRRGTILSIDPFERRSRDPLNPKGRYSVYLEHIRQAGYDHVCVPLVAFSQDAAPAVPEGIGVLVVDGDHRYESVKQDLALYCPKLAKGGLVFIDDYVPAYKGVQDATDEFFAAHPEFEVLHRSYFVIAERRPAGQAP
jgi:glycosyltransferase involved in cell wall biosynthesis/predicted O-methyltransferase YrrM